MEHIKDTKEVFQVVNEAAPALSFCNITKSNRIQINSNQFNVSKSNETQIIFFVTASLTTAPLRVSLTKTFRFSLCFWVLVSRWWLPCCCFTMMAMTNILRLLSWTSVKNCWLPSSCGEQILKHISLKYLIWEAKQMRMSDIIYNSSNRSVHRPIAHLRNSFTQHMFSSYSLFHRIVQKSKSA